MLIIYRKDTGEVVQYVPHNGTNITPSLMGVYSTCLKYNYPKIGLDEYGEVILPDEETGVLSTYWCRVVDGQLVTIGLIEFSPPFPTEPTGSLEERLLQMEQEIQRLRMELENK